MTLKWDKRSLSGLSEILDYIAEDSPQNAHHIAGEIDQIFEIILLHPHKFPVDKYKKKNDDSYRAFELKQIRFSYRIFGEEILVVRCRHTEAQTS